MKYIIDKESNTSIYLQLYKQLKNDIVLGIYPHKSRLPSKRLLSEELGISIISVQHAYELLCDEGYAESRERSGYFAAYIEGDPYARSGIGETKPRMHSAALEGGETDTAFPFSVYAGTVRRVLSDYGENIFVKSPNNGCLELREAVADYLRRARGISISPDRIVIGSGSEYLYGIVLRILGNDRVYGIEDPSYHKIRQVYEANGARCQLLKMSQGGILTDDLERTDATVLHVTPYRSFPSGITASASKRMEYIRWAEKRQGFIVEDDFDSEFTFSTKPEETIFAMSGGSNVIYINTFSQTVAPSVRAGYMLLSDELYKIYEEKAGFYSCTVPTFEQYVLARFIENGDFERHINRVRRRKRSAKNI